MNEELGSLIMMCVESLMTKNVGESRLIINL